MARTRGHGAQAGRILARLDEAQALIGDRLDRLAAAVPPRTRPRLSFGEYWEEAMRQSQNDPAFAAALTAAARQLRRERWHSKP